MLPGGIIASLVATYHTVLNQLRCKPHDYREDEFTTDGVSTQTCKKCWKRIKLKGLK